jgi:hypothetical protein
MHAENFDVVVQQLSLRTVEIKPIDQGTCLITVSRIPREWLLERPCMQCLGKLRAEGLVKLYPEKFRTPHTR